jgi:signal transduction histidine kinase
VTRARRRSAAHPQISSQACDDYLTRVAPALHGSLHSILGWAEMRPTGIPNDAEVDRAASAIIRQAHQQSWILHELLEVWRASAGTLRLDASPLVFSEMIDRALWAVQPIAHTAAVRIARQVDASASQSIVGDAKRLTQAVMVLLCHAITFAPPRGILIVHAECAHGVAELSISDEHSSVAPAVLSRTIGDRAAPPHLIERAAAHEAHVRAQGGPGVSFARDIITSHHGRLLAYAAPGGGGVAFHVQVPRVHEVASAPGAAT